VFIKPKPDFGKSTILSQWPSNPGSDPANYSWEAKQKGAEEDQNGAEREQRNRKEEARRRKRTEKFLNQERGQTAEATSQPMVVNPSGSQPVVAHNGFSSQTVEDVPMTQPDRGAFGSRSVQKSKKAKKHRTAGF
jgi:RNA polymerase I-specific transcription initiation factor RRN6